MFDCRETEDGGRRGKHSRDGAWQGWDFGCDIEIGMGRHFPPLLRFGTGSGKAHILWDWKGIGVPHHKPTLLPTLNQHNLSFPGNNINLELKMITRSPSLNSFLTCVYHVIPLSFPC